MSTHPNKGLVGWERKEKEDQWPLSLVFLGFHSRDEWEVYFYSRKQSYYGLIKHQILLQINFSYHAQPFS